MAKTLISDLLTPAVWAEYGLLRSATLSALWQSGIVGPVMDSKTGRALSVPDGGGTVNLPYFNDLTSSLQNIAGSTPLSVNNIGAAADIAAVIGRGNAWSVNDLAGVLSGADPLKAIMDLLANYWAREMQVELINLLTGAFGAASMSGNVSDISALSTEALRAINQNTFIDAVQLLGDAKSSVVAVAMHSATEAYLAKQQMIVYETTADKGPRVGFYQGKRVIVDDGLPVSSGTYTTYIFGEGAIGFSEAVIGDKDIETDRDILAGDSVLTMRRKFLLHPRGIKWSGTAAAEFPSRTELATGTNWTRVYPNKKIRIVQLKHKIA
jgi:hypothetical protein